MPAAVLLAIARCGGQSHHKVAAAPARPYRCFIGIAGTQPSVELEDRAAGTGAWRLPGPAADVGGASHGDISGYVSRQAVRPGESETIYLNAPGASSVRIRVFRIGWYGGVGGRQVLASQALPLEPACTHRPDTGLTQVPLAPHAQLPDPRIAAQRRLHHQAIDGRRRDRLPVRRRGLKAATAARAAPHLHPRAYNARGGNGLYPGSADRVG